MILRLIVTLWVGLMISTACMAFVPAIGFAAARFTCDGDFSTGPAMRKNLKFFCTDPQTGAKTEIHPFKVMAISTLVYSALLFLPFTLLGATMRRTRTRIDAARRAALAAAIPAQATVVALAETGMAIKKSGRTTRDVGLKLTLNVDHPQRGAYQAEINWLVSELNFARVQPGEVVPVKVNAEFPERVYPNVDWADFIDWKIVKNQPGAAGVSQA